MAKSSEDPRSAFQREFAARMEKFRRLLKQTSARADEKNVHQLRVSARRLRAAIAIAQAAGADGKSERKTLKRLKKLGKVLGVRRERDVLERDLRALGLPHAVMTDKTAGKEELRKSLRHKKKLARDLKSVAGDLEAGKAESFGAIVHSLRTKVDALRAARYQRAEELHALRIEIKKIRYAFEILGIPVEPLKSLQAILGELHDADVLARYLRDRDEKHALAIVEKRRDEKAQAAQRRIRPVLASMRQLLVH